MGSFLIFLQTIISLYKLGVFQFAQQYFQMLQQQKQKGQLRQNKKFKQLANIKQESAKQYTKNQNVKQNKHKTKISSEKPKQYQNIKNEENKQTVLNLKKMSSKENQNKKKVIILIPLTIPATGKSTMFKNIKQGLGQYHVQILSCDQIRAQKMQRILEKDTNLTKHEAEAVVNPAANKKYFKTLAEDLKDIEKNQQYGDSILILDRNHTQTSIKKPLQQIKLSASRCKGLDVKVVAIIPKCDEALSAKNKYHYPFSSCYIASCTKRVLQRQEHQVLEDSQLVRANTCVCFANMFRNFTFTNRNLSQYFDSVIRLPFHREQQVPKQITSEILKVMLGNKPGCYDIHPRMKQLIQKIKAWEMKEHDFVEFDIKQIKRIIESLFQNFDNLRVDVQNFPGEEIEQIYEFGDDYFDRQIIEVFQTEKENLKGKENVLKLKQRKSSKNYD